ncbi:MAG: hypothetical protein JWN03_2245 [Nocardia sp.]|nr:hypothetical protein [Nocardia sp.]
MSRRRPTPDPVFRTAAERIDYQRFELAIREILTFFGVTGADVVLARLSGISFSEIARQLGLSESRCRQIYYNATSVLEVQAGRPEGLRAYANHDFARVFSDRDDERIGSMGYKLENEPMPWCERHNRLAGLGSWVRCAVCPCRFESRPRGQRQVYCSAACRQAAHRQRDKKRRAHT